MRERKVRTINENILIEALEAIGEGEDAIRRDYSGKGMYGDKCFGVTLSGDHKLAALFVSLTEIVIGDAPMSGLEKSGLEVSDVKRMAMETCSDSMGRDESIYYWPGYQLEDN